MISGRAIDYIMQAVDAEENVAISEYGLFHSNHEAWAVLREEVEELCECLDDQEAMHHRLDLIWDKIRRDETISEGDMMEIYNWAQRCAEEAVQVMAMIQKWGESVEQRKPEEG